jgi:hypothetical protein
MQMQMQHHVLLPDWVDLERAGGGGAKEEGPDAMAEEEDQDDDDDDAADDEDYRFLQRGAAYPLPAHAFLLAPALLHGCMGGGASSVVRGAALAVLAGADLGGAFLRLRREVDRQRRALDDAGLEIAQLRDETARLSVSSVAGFF